MCRILVVDEQPVMRALLAEVLAQHGHETECTGSEDEALAMLDRAEVENVLVHPSDSTGNPPGLLAYLSEQEGAPRVPILVLDERDVAGEARVAFAALHVGGSEFTVPNLIACVDECARMRCGRHEERRSAFWVRTTGHDMMAHVNGIGPWQVLDISAEGLGLIAEMDLGVGGTEGVLLRDENSVWEGPMRVRNKIERGGGAFRYGLGWRRGMGRSPALLRRSAHVSSGSI